MFDQLGSVSRMFRIRAPDYSTTKSEVKEYLYFEENWNEGPDHWVYNMFGAVIAPVMAHVEGMYQETLHKDVIKTFGTTYDFEGNPEPDERMIKDFASLRPRYYIPFTKKKAEEIIKKSAYTDASSIKFIVKISPGDYSAGGSALRHEITADIFLNWTFDELFTWMTYQDREKPIDYTRASIANVNKTANSLAFTPS